jgi:hypothetical protein
VSEVEVNRDSVKIIKRRNLRKLQENRGNWDTKKQNKHESYSQELTVVAVYVFWEEKTCLCSTVAQLGVPR